MVIAILALLLAILSPALTEARHRARRAACAANLRQVGVAIHLYAHDFDDSIPFGPAGRPVTGSNFYTVTRKRDQPAVARRRRTRSDWDCC